MTWIPVELEGTEGGGLPGEEGDDTLNMIFLLRNPGRPSYQMPANNCWQLGWATNCKGRTARERRGPTLFCRSLMASFRRERSSEAGVPLAETCDRGDGGRTGTYVFPGVSRRVEDDFQRLVASHFIEHIQ